VVQAHEGFGKLMNCLSQRCSITKCELAKTHSALEIFAFFNSIQTMLRLQFTYNMHVVISTIQSCYGLKQKLKIGFRICRGLELERYIDEVLIQLLNRRRMHHLVL
jgi:hypothetical protein